MTHKERLRQALEYLGYKNKDFASALGLSHVYVSRLLTQSDRKMSPQLAENIENKFGISADWLLTGRGKMLCTFSKSADLNEVQRVLIAEFESLDLKQKEAALAFVRMLKRIEKENKLAHEAEKMEEYSKFLEWQNQQKQNSKR